MDTDALIRQLVENAGPVRRLRPAWARGLLWLALGLPAVLLVVAVDRVAFAPRTPLADTRLAIEVAAILATAATAAIAAFASTIPGASRRWLLLPALPLAIWLANIGEACIADWKRLGLESLMLRFDGPCFLPMVLMGLVPTAAMMIMLRRGMPLSPRLTLALGALAVAALANLGLRLVHVPDVSFMALIWNFAAVALLSAILTRRNRSIPGRPQARS